MHPDPFHRASAASQGTALAFDSGPDGFAWAAVSQPRPRHFTLIASGHLICLTHSEIVREARALHATHAPRLLAYETFGGYVSSARMSRQRTNSLDISDLLASAYIAGMLHASLPNPDQAVTLPANGPDNRPDQWRYWLTGAYRQGDKGVAKALDAYLDGGLPRRGKRKDGTPIYALNEHRRDAAGLAVAAFLYTAAHARTGSGQ